MLLNIIFGALSIIGIGLTIYYGRKAIILEREKKSLSWPQLQLIGDATSFNLKKDNFIPDAIITPGPRGAILAELLLNKFHRHIPAFVGISYIQFGIEAMPSFKEYFTMSALKGWNIYLPKSILDFKDKKVLIVDDFCLTGEFNIMLKNFLISQGYKAENIKIFCAVITKVTKSAHREPDYYHVVTDDDYFYFPWGKANTG